MCDLAGHEVTAHAIHMRQIAVRTGDQTTSTEGLDSGQCLRPTEEHLVKR